MAVTEPVKNEEFGKWKTQNRRACRGWQTLPPAILVNTMNLMNSDDAFCLRDIREQQGGMRGARNTVLFKAQTTNAPNIKGHSRATR